VVYVEPVFEVLRTDTFDAWLRALRDHDARARILVRLRRLSLGNPGQHRVLKDGIVELKIDYGPGYRVYYTQRGKLLVLLLCGGDKATQKTDIAEATRLAKEWRE
jgi:putative addiction module killer protein